MMETVFIGALVALAVSIIMLFTRFMLGPTVFDRILAVNLAGTNIILVILFMDFSSGAKDYIDIALVYAFLNFIATIGFLRYFRYGFNK